MFSTPFTKSLSGFTNGSFTKHITDTFSRWGDKMALIDGPTERGVKFSELNDILGTLAGNLYHVAGIRKGEVVCICAPNSVNYGMLMMALPSTGGVFTGCNPAYSPDEIISQIKDCNAKYFFTSSGNQHLVPKLLAACPQIREVYIFGEDVTLGNKSFNELLKPGKQAPDVLINTHEDLAMLPYSSGTTGLPKGVMLSHFNLIAALYSASEPSTLLLEDGQDSIVTIFPFAHIAGSLGLYVMMMHGCTTVLYPQFEFEAYLAANAKYKATYFGIPPPIMVGLAKHPIVSKYDLSSVNFVIIGAAPSSKELHDEVMKRLPHIKEIRTVYAMTENTATCCTQYRGDTNPYTVGKAAPSVELKVVDIETGKDLLAGKEGEIVMRGPTVMKGYLNQPERTAETIKNGWLHTGDIGKYDENGHVYITDRLKELIKYKGFQVAPAELEALLLTHPAVADVAVIGVPDLQAGELPRAYIVLKAGHKANRDTADDIKSFIKEHIAYYKQLRGGIEFVQDIPKSPSGKILRRIIKDQYMANNTKAKL